MDISRRQQVRATAASIGRRIRLGRDARGLTQSALGAALGITYQQVQKYENGKSPVTACALVAIAAELDLEVGYFLPNGIAAVGPSEIASARAELAACKDALREASRILSSKLSQLRAREERIEAAPAREPFGAPAP